MAQPKTTRRQILAGLSAMTLGVNGAKAFPCPAQNPEMEDKLMIACFIRYQIDPFQREAFKKYAETWGRIIPRWGGHLIGYFLPYEGTNDIAWGLIAFENLAAYESYRQALRKDEESRANFEFAQSKRFIIREERNFVELVDGTFERPSSLHAKG